MRLSTVNNVRRRTPAGSGSLSTGEVAQVFGVSTRLVTQWFDAGEFAGGWRIPGGRRERRIPVAAVRAMAARHGVPFDEADCYAVLIVTRRAEFYELRRATIDGLDRHWCRCAAPEGAAEAARQAQPATVIVDDHGVAAAELESIVRRLAFTGAQLVVDSDRLTGAQLQALGRLMMRGGGR